MNFVIHPSVFYPQQIPALGFRKTLLRPCANYQTAILRFMDMIPFDLNSVFSTFTASILAQNSQRTILISFSRPPVFVLSAPLTIQTILFLAIQTAFCPCHAVHQKNGTAQQFKLGKTRNGRQSHHTHIIQL